VRLLLAALVAALSAHIVRALYLQKTNTLENNGRWVSLKPGLARPVVGALAYTRNRNSLYRNRLQLGVWHGFQQVMAREPMALTRAEFTFGLGASEYLTFLFQDSAVGFAGVLVSAREGIGSKFVLGRPDGEFEQRVPLPLRAGTIAPGRHEIVVRSDGSRAEVVLDGTSLGGFEVALPRAGRVGFRGSGGSEVWVDDVVLHRADSASPIRDDFRNRKGGWLVFFCVLSTVLLVLFVLERVAARRRWEQPGFHVVGVGALIVVLCAMTFSVDYFYWARLFPAIDFADYLAADNPFESRDDVVRRLERIHPVEKPPGVRRVLFLGSSQTWGAGARSLDDVFVTRLERMLNESAPKVRYEFINLSISGAAGPALVRIYLKRFLERKPDVVVANLGHNGKDYAKLRRSLNRLAVTNRRRGIHTVFVLEAASLEVNERDGEHHLRRLDRNHRIMKKVAARYGIPTIDMHAHLAANADAGFLWWDRVHPTSFGHRLIAQKLFDERDTLLPSD